MLKNLMTFCVALFFTGCNVSTSGESNTTASRTVLPDGVAPALTAGVKACLSDFDARNFQSRILTGAGFTQINPAEFELYFDDGAAGVEQTERTFNGSNEPRIHYFVSDDRVGCSINLFRVGEPFSQTISIVRQYMVGQGWTYEKDFLTGGFKKGDSVVSFTTGGVGRSAIYVHMSIWEQKPGGGGRPVPRG
ncbi:MAG: hypothetical protein ABJP90_02900 [Paracoccaceae bacterium]